MESFLETAAAARLEAALQRLASPVSSLPV